MKTYTERVYQGIVDLYRAKNLLVTRQQLVVHLSLSPSIVSNAIKTLVEVQQRVVWCDRGRYRPAQVFREDEAVSWTALPDGTFKLEKGDQLMHFTPREYAWLFPAARTPVAQESGHGSSDMQASLLKQTRDKLRKLESEIAEIKMRGAPQMDLQLVAAAQ